MTKIVVIENQWLPAGRVGVAIKGSMREIFVLMEQLCIIIVVMVIQICTCDKIS